MLVKVQKRHDLVVRYSQVEESRIVVKKQMPLCWRPGDLDMKAV